MTNDSDSWDDIDKELFTTFGRYERIPLTAEKAQEQGLPAYLIGVLAERGAVLYVSSDGGYYCQAASEASQQELEQILHIENFLLDKGGWQRWGNDIRIIVRVQSREAQPDCEHDELITDEASVMDYVTFPDHPPKE